MSVIRASLSPGRILIGVWMLALVAAGIFLHPIAWLLLVLNAVALGFYFLINVGAEAGENWSKALYGEQESKNHWSRKKR